MLLREQGAHPARFAIPSLHFRSAHPETLKVYEALGTDSAPGLRELAALCRTRLAGRLAMPDSDNAEGCDLLFVSHLTAPSQWARTDSDTYFGDLPWQLQAMGHSVRIALIDHTTAPFDDFPPTIVSSVSRILLPRRLERATEAAIAKTLAIVAADLRAGSDNGNLRSLAARQAGQGPARQSMRIATSIAGLVARHRPKALIFTYEGHAWERTAMRLSRQAVPGLRCIAVHHAILAPMQHAMTTRYGAPMDPDAILAAGRPALDWLSQSAGLAGLAVDLLGSPRARPATPAPDKLKDGRRCLFLPEGMQSESTFLALAAYDLATARPDLICTIRLHPLTSRAALSSAEPRLREAPLNIDWSPPERSLEEDGQHATWAVYRGSSAIISAMTCGAVPVYLGDEPPELRIDPLRGAGDIVQVVKTAVELSSALNPSTISLKGLQAGWAFAQEYYTPMDPGGILRHISPSAAPPPQFMQDDP